MKPFLATLLAVILSSILHGQELSGFADSIRIKYNIPELAYAVVSAETVLEFQVLGERRIKSGLKAQPGDRFHLGSNTKAITSFIAATLVDRHIIRWNTNFFDLFPEEKAKSRKEYYHITLQDLLTFRGKLPAYTYTFAKPTNKQITGDAATQRLKLARYFLSQPPIQSDNGLTPSNADYILAGMMLEKATHKPFKTLVADLGKTLGIHFGFDYPNLSDAQQPWGHDVNLNPVPPAYNDKLNWLLSAGNINVSLPDYAKFIQLQLKGLRRQTNILPSETFEKLLYGLPVFSFGWFNRLDTSTNYHIAYNEGNAGAFITYVEVIKDRDRAYIVFTNSASDDTKNGVMVLVNELRKEYDKRIR